MNKKLKRFLPKKKKYKAPTIYQCILNDIFLYGRSMIKISPGETKVIGYKEYTNLGENDVYASVNKEQTEVKTVEFK